MEKRKMFLLLLSLVVFSLIVNVVLVLFFDILLMKSFKYDNFFLELVSDIIVQFLMITLYIILINKYLKKNVLQLFSLKNIKMMDVFFTLLTVFIIVGLDYLLEFFIDFPALTFFDDLYNEIYPEPLNSIETIFFFISAIILTPISEELFFRGLCFKIIRGHFTFTNSYLISFLLFFLFHLDPRMLLFIFIANFFFCYLYEKKQNLLYPILSHSFVNLIGLGHYIF
jgi:membrane protease YdiL (CAAX protease family)